MSINARFASFRPRTTAFRQAGFGTAARRAAAFRATTLRRFRAVTAGRIARGMPATRGFRPLGLRSNGEKKLIDVAVATYQVNTTGTFTLLNSCIQGSDYSNRIGRKIVCKSLYVRGYYAQEGSLSATVNKFAPSQYGRMILFVDSQPNGLVPATTDLLNSASPSSQLNLNNRDRFKILSDETFTLDPYVTVNTATQAICSTVNQIRDLNVYRKINLETIFNSANGGTIADINSGALYMFWIGSVAAAADTDANAVVSTRVRFVDS